MTDSGYDPAFLGRALPLPDAPGRPVRRLDYPHFSVVLDLMRRLAAVTAVNIDGARILDLPRTGDWRLDPRVSVDQQAGPEVYARNDLDRGHLVRRRDPGWGDATTARTASEATFAYPNAAPQASGFNQSKELWLGLEDHVLGYADAEDSRVSVFTAPFLADDDPHYRGIGIPQRFWKIAAWADGEALAAAGFVLDQSDLLDLDETAVRPLGAFRTFQVPISDIADRSGVEFGALVDADVSAMPAAREGGAGWRPLASQDDIALR